ncbi:inositol monophosphatase family protein [Minwuia sp.]|uniref:inositol monophosphatase family protein n=1 Tax=Minwuia sp. TaxID=2493630 RepID=UPI003A901A77
MTAEKDVQILKYAVESAQKFIDNNLPLDQNIDEKVEKLIQKILIQRSPYNIVGEECGEISKGSALTWVIDPIDGTRNMLRGIPFSAVSIALLHKKDAMIGCVANLATKDVYFARRGFGSWLNGKRISVSGNTLLGESVVFQCHGKSMQDKITFSRVNFDLCTRTTTRKIGSTALALCYVADGRADAFISSGDRLWDYAAGLLIVEEAKGRISDWSGQLLEAGRSDILASNRLLHSECLDITSKHHGNILP